MVSASYFSFASVRSCPFPGKLYSEFKCKNFPKTNPNSCISVKDILFSRYFCFLPIFLCIYIFFLAILFPNIYASFFLFSYGNTGYRKVDGSKMMFEEEYFLYAVTPSIFLSIHFLFNCFSPF